MSLYLQPVQVMSLDLVVVLQSEISGEIIWWNQVRLVQTLLWSLQWRSYGGRFLCKVRGSWYPQLTPCRAGPSSLRTNTVNTVVSYPDVPFWTRNLCCWVCRILGWLVPGAAWCVTCISGQFSSWMCPLLRKVFSVDTLVVQLGLVFVGTLPV